MKKHFPPKGHWLDNLIVWLGQQINSKPHSRLPTPMSSEDFWFSLSNQGKQTVTLSLQASPKRGQPNGYGRSSFTYSSRVKRDEPLVNVVRGVFYQKEKDLSAPTVLLVHGNGMPNHILEEKYALFCSLLGYQTIYMDLPYHMSRRPPGKKRQSLSADLELTRLNIGQGLIDNLDLVRWLKEERKIKQIGVIGTSVGGLIALLLATQFPLSFAVPIVPAVDLTYLLWEGIPLGGIRAKIEKGGISSRKCLEPYLEPLLPKFTKSIIPPEDILLIRGKQDEIVGTENIESLIQTWHLPNVLSLSGGHLSSSGKLFFFGFPKLLKDFLLTHYQTY